MAWQVMALAVPVLTLGLVSCRSTVPAAPSAQPVAPESVSAVPVDRSRPAHEVYRNITIFTRGDVSADFFDELMEGISSDLGVACAHCHDPAAMHRGDLGSRKTLARETVPVMWDLVLHVNTTDFPGKGGPVRCWTCHRGTRSVETMRPGA